MIPLKEYELTLADGNHLWVTANRISFTNNTEEQEDSWGVVGFLTYDHNQRLVHSQHFGSAVLLSFEEVTND